MADKIISIDDLELDNTIKLVPATETEPEFYRADNGIVKSDFYQLGNKVVYEFKGRQFVWKPLDMKYIDEFGEEDVLYTVTDVPLETKANYARFNRAMPDVDDWFIQENEQLKHQILIQGFQRDPFELLFGHIDFAIGGEIQFDTDLKIFADGIEQTGAFETTGAIDFVDENGETFFHLPEIVAYDSKIPVRAMTGGKYRALNDGSGIISFQIVIDNDWISSTERVYPLVIDPTVIVSAAYDTSGNGGRKIVRANSGNLYAVARNGTTDFRIYKSTDNGTTWALLVTVTETVNDVAMTTDGTYLYILNSYSTTEIRFRKYNESGTLQGSMVDAAGTSQTEIATGNVAIAIDGSGVLHAAWSAKINTHPNSFNIFFTKSTDGGATWATITMLTSYDNTGYNNYGPSVAIKSDGYPVYVWYLTVSGLSDEINFRLYTAGGQAGGGLDAQSSVVEHVSVIGKKQGSDIGMVAVVYAVGSTIKGRYSVNAGSSWTDFTGLGNTGAKPILAENAAGDIYVFYQNGSAIDYKKCPNGTTAFGTATTFTSAGTNPNVMEREVSTIIGAVFMDGSTVKFDKLFFNVAPTAPTNLNPTGGVIKDRAQIIQFTWQHNDNPGEAQSKFDLQYRLQGAGTWTTVTQTTSNQYYDLPAATLAAGAYEWQVRTYDPSNAVSPYSSISAFNAATKTPTPTITAPADASTVITGSINATWSSSGQVQYELKLLDASGTNTLWTDTQTNGNTSKTITYNLVNGVSYKVSLRVMDSGGLWSDADINSFNVSFTPPAKPTIALVKDDLRGSVTATIESPVPAGTVPAITATEIHRSDAGEYVRISAGVSYVPSPNLLPPFTEWTMHANAVINGPYKYTLNVSGAGNASDCYIAAIPGVAYTLNCVHTGQIRLLQYDINNNILVDSGYTTNASITISNTHASIDRIRVMFSNPTTSGTLTFEDPQLELGTVVTLFSAKGANAVFNIAPANITNNFVGKVSGSTVENPHSMKRNNGNASLVVPTGSWSENSTAQYTDVSSLNGVVVSSSNTLNAQIAQHIFPFSLVSLIERGGFPIPSSDKVQWLKDNVISAMANWYGNGSGPAGNKAYLSRWNGTSWVSFSTNTASSPALIQKTMSSSDLATAIDANGAIFFNSYADASNGTVASVINTDYIDIVVTFKYHINRASFTDYEPQPLADVDYYAQAVGNNGTYTQSAVATIAPNVAFTQISSLTDPTKYATLQKASTLQKNSTIDSAKMKFAGRDYAMVEFGTSKESAFDYKYYVFTWDELQTIEELATSGETLLLRDNKGRKAYVAVDGVNVTEKGTHWEIGIRPDKVYYVEGV